MQHTHDSSVDYLLRYSKLHASAADITIGTGTPISPLSPAPLRSVAPIGMFAPPREVAAEDVTAPDPGTDDSPDDTGKPSAIVPQPTVSPVLMSGEMVPPASNMLLGLTGLELNGTTAEPVRTGHSDGA